MEIWIAVAVLGGMVSLVGIALIVRRYRQGLVSGLELGAVLGAYGLIIAFLVATEVFLSRPVGTAFLVLMMPFWFLVVSRARKRPER